MNWRQKWDGFETIEVGPINPRKLKIAISLHIYYFDYINILYQKLQYFDFEFDLFISTSVPQIETAARKKFSKISNIENLFIKVTPNKGRNFAPLIIEFGKILKNYDILGHFHSKKSLYTKRNQKEWADYLIDNLLDNAKINYFISSLISSSNKIGLLFLTTPPTIPFWANHWLKNASLARKLYQKLNYKIDYLGFITYPIGGMFWARVDAIKPFLELEFSWNDFPQELGQTDGTLHHGLERFISVVCKKNGYELGVFHPEAGHTCIDDSYVLAQYSESLEILRLKNYREFNLSFDLFDTILCRTTPYDDFQKYEAAKSLGFRNDEIQKYVQYRNKTEIHLRQNMIKGDIDLNQIAIEMTSSEKMNKIDPNSIVLAEVEAEACIIQPKIEVIKILKSQQIQKKISTIVTDTYYLKPDIIKFIEKIGIENKYLKFSVSTDSGLRKDRGDYWLKQIEENNYIQNTIHIGDNIVSDIQIPVDLGIKVIYLANARDMAQLTGNIINNEYTHPKDKKNYYLKIYQNPLLFERYHFHKRIEILPCN
jgi:FMN phosphatase YigB (HAD superfamily)